MAAFSLGATSVGPWFPANRSDMITCRADNAMEFCGINDLAFTLRTVGPKLSLPTNPTTSQRSGLSSWPNPGRLHPQVHYLRVGPPPPYPVTNSHRAHAPANFTPASTPVSQLAPILHVHRDLFRTSRTTPRVDHLDIVVPEFFQGLERSPPVFVQGLDGKRGARGHTRGP